MSFGQKPNAWARPGDSIVNAAQSQQINPNLFTNQLGLAAAAGQPFGGLNLGTSLNALVNQAAFTNMNVLAQAQAAQRAQHQLLPQNVNQSGRASSPSGNRNQRTFLGTVTKLMDTYGFVDEDVFFQTSVIRGPTQPRVGDRVMVEASYNPSMPFKWNAYRIQIPLPEHTPNMQNQLYQSSQQISSQSNRWNNSNNNDRNRDDHSTQPRQHLLATPSSERNYRSTRRSPSLRNERRASPVRQRSPYRKLSPPRKPPTSRSTKNENTSKRERERTPPVRESRENTRARSPANTVVSKRDGDSPPRRRQRISPRYYCYHPKQLIGSYDLKYADIQRRYNNLYIPSDFIHCNMSWLSSMQIQEQIKISPHPIRFSVLHKDVDVLLDEGQSLPIENPPDADSRYIVKVLLLSHFGQTATNSKVFGLLPDGSLDDTETQSILKNIFFLVGSRNKNEFMCIGGAWSPSLDGVNPKDPQTMINTAIRTTHALTGVDLTECPKWYEMAQIRYFRTERNRMDTVVLMFPDINASLGLMPTVEKFRELEEKFKKQLNEKLSLIDSEEFLPPSPTNIAATKDSPSNTAKANVESEAIADTNLATTHGANLETSTTEATSDVQDNSVVNNGKIKTPNELLNIKNMKLREELEARGLDSRGIKNALVQRLEAALNSEKEEEERETESSIMEDTTKHPVVTIKEEIIELMEDKGVEQTSNEALNSNHEVEMTEELVEKEDDSANEKAEKDLEKAKEKFEKDKKERKAALEKSYIFPKEPSILVFPSKIAKGGKFECKTVSLAALLDYRLDDNKEASFEVFLFAEAFREALDRSNAFVIYKTLMSALDKDAEKKRREDALSENKETNPVNSEATNTENSNDKKEGESIKEDKKTKTDFRHNYKALVNYVDVFSAFAYFDENVTGSIEERDLEEILHSLSLNISRSHVHKLIKKVSSRDHINYRNITDKWVDKDGNVKYTATPAIESSKLDLVKGVFSFLETNSKAKTIVAPSLDSTPDVTDSGVVVYKGSVLNIAQCIDQSKNLEDERNSTLLKNEELELNLKTIKEQRDYLEKKKRRFEEDLERYKTKLHDADKTLKITSDENIQMKASLQDCKKYGERLIHIVDKIIPPPKKEEKKDEKKEGTPKEKKEDLQKDKKDETSKDNKDDQKDEAQKSDDKKIDDKKDES